MSLGEPPHLGRYAAGPPRHANMSDIARAAGVSNATTSRALNNLPGVAPATRERVLRAAREFAYVVSPEASALWLCMFDGEDRLVVSNSRFAEIYGLPSGILKPGMTLTETVAAMLAAPVRALAEDDDDDAVAASVEGPTTEGEADEATAEHEEDAE